MTRVTRIDRTKPGILYVLAFEMEGKTLVKIGVTHRRIEDRVSEILVSVFKKYREFPYCRPKRFKTTRDAYKKEKALHKIFSSYAYQTAKKFDGSTEFFTADLDAVVEEYDKMVEKGTCRKPKTRKGVFFTANRDLGNC